MDLRALHLERIARLEALKPSRHFAINDALSLELSEVPGSTVGSHVWDASVALAARPPGALEPARGCWRSELAAD